MRKIAILSTIVFGLILHFQLTHAQQIYKWVDEKGTTHYADNVNAVPEKYRNQVQKRDVDELPPVLTYKPQTPQSSQSYSSGPSGNTAERARPARRVESESVDSSPSPGYVPLEKFMHITKGMTEAEVLSRLGSPTREEQGEVKSKGTVSGGAVSGFVDAGGNFSGSVSGGSFKGETIVVKRYYYIGDRSKGEQTRVITFEKGKVVSCQSISP